MRPATKILMMSSARKGQHEREDRPDDGYRDPESRFRDSRGRERYNDGRYAPRGTYDDGSYGGPVWPTTPYIPPVYERRYAGGGDARPVSRIGFALEGQMDRIPPEYGQAYRFDEQRRTDEISHKGGMKSYERSFGSDYTPFTQEVALEWISSMKNEDGTTGPHWSMEQTEQARKQRNIDCDPIQFFAAMNMMYSDYCKVAEKVNSNSMDFYAYMAKAFLDDKDAVKDKMGKYFACIVKH